MSGLRSFPRRIGALLAAAVAILGLALAANAQGDRVAQLFAGFDVNGDGRISHNEFELKKVEMLFSRSTTRGASLSFEDTLVSRAAFDAIDADRDGRVTAADVVGSPIFSFETFDANRDGHIDRAEFAAQLGKLLR